MLLSIFSNVKTEKDRKLRTILFDIGQNLTVFTSEKTVSIRLVLGEAIRAYNYILSFLSPALHKPGM